MQSVEDKDAFIVRYLLERKGEVISGEEISVHLGISRVALKKRVDKMLTKGIPIKVYERKGYLLEDIPDLLYPEVVKALLDTRVIGKNYLFYQVVDSTNRVARDMAKEGAEEGTVVLADSQTAGRGRLGRRWHSPPGKNLYFSVILRPKLSPVFLYHATMLAAVSVCEVLRDMGVDALIKWPNDVYVSDRKICGVLNEAEISQGAVDFLILGIGVNVNAMPDDFPPDVKGIATSLKMELGRDVKRLDVLVGILTAMDRWYAVLSSGNTAELFSYWRRHNYLIGKRIIVDGRLEGEAVGVTPMGELIIRNDRGETLTVAAGDVEIKKFP